MFRPKAAMMSALVAALLAACGQAPLTEAPQVPELAAAALPAGSLDPDFKKSFLGFGNGGGFATHIAKLPNDKALVVFSAIDANDRNFVIVRRFNEDGSHDRTFGGTGNTQATIRGGLPNLIPQGIVVTPEGRIFVAVTGLSSNLSTVRPLIFALTPAGTRDPGFGLHSPSTALANPSTANISAADLAYDPTTKKLTLGGTVRPKNGGNDFLWTYTVAIDNTNFPKETVVKKADADLSFEKFRRLPGGETLIAGGITPAGEGGIPRGYLVRQLDNGLIVREAVNVVGLETFLTGLRVDGGKVFLAGSAFTSGLNTQGFVARFNLETLTKDTSFGSSGIRFVSNEVRDLAFSNGSGTAKKVLVAGTDGTDYLVARMSYGGKLDTAFGKNGIALVNFSNAVDERALALSVDGKNRIWAAGLTEPFNGGGFRAGLFCLLP